MTMLELVKTIRVVGLRRLLTLRRAQRLAWPGMLNGFYVTRIMQTMFNVGFLDEIREKGSVEIDAFATSRNLDLPVFASLCDALFSLKILDKEGRSYRLNPRGSLLVEVARGWFDGAYGYEEIFHFLEPLLRREKSYGNEVRRRSVFIAKGSAAMESWLYFPLAIDYITRQGYRKALDLGCGEGTFLRHLCQSNPDIAAYGIDLAPDTVAAGRLAIRAVGLEDRIQLFVEDIERLDRVPDPLRSVDVATTFFVLHEIAFAGDDRVVEFLRSYRLLFPGVPLLVFEVDRPTAEEMRKRPGMAIPYLLQHDLSHQKLLPRDDWKRLFHAAGFSRVQVRSLRFARSVIFTLH